VSARVHHSAVCVADVEASLAFYRDGLGLEVFMDQHFEGDWPTLLEAPSPGLRSVMLGDPAEPDAGIVELVAFDGGVAPGSPPARPATGFFLLSLFVDVEATLARLAGLGHTDVRRITVPAPDGSEVPMATLRDPDGVLVELIGAGTGG